MEEKMEKENNTELENKRPQTIPKHWCVRGRWFWVVIVILVIAAVGLYVSYENRDKEVPKEKNNSQNYEANLNLIIENYSVKTDGVFSEPVEYQLVNDSSSSISFKMGCSVNTPLIYKVNEDSSLTELPQPESSCAALPETISLDSGQSSDKYKWYLVDYFGETVADGNYKIGIQYDISNEKGVVYSDVIKIKRSALSKIEIDQICSEATAYANYYSDCNKR